jgi:hypothetical protein
MKKSTLETALHPDNWSNPRNFDPDLIAEAREAVKQLKETLNKDRKGR